MKQSWIRACIRSARACLVCLLLAVLAAGCGGKAETPEAASAGSVSSADSTEDAGRGDAGEADAGGDRRKIGFVVKENSRDHWLRMQTAAQAVCDENDVELLFLAGSKNAVAAEQIEKIDELIAEGVDAICIAPISDEMVHAALGRAAEQGIPVFAVDTDTAFAGKQTFIGTDNYAAGKAGAVFAAEAIGNRGTAVILRGTLGDTAHDERAEGIADGLQAHGVTVLETCFSSPSSAKEDVKKLLQLYPELDLIITTEDEITWNAWQRILTSGNSTVCLYGFDGMAEVAELTARDPQMLGTTAQDPEEIGRCCVETVLAYLAGESVEQEVLIPYRIVDRASADDYCAGLNG